MTAPSLDQRGQSEVLGTVLLLAMVVIVGVAVAATAMGAFGGTQAEAEREAIEQALLELRSVSTAVAMEGEAPKTVDLDLPSSAQLEVREEVGSIAVYHHDYSGPEATGETQALLEETTLGAVVVTHNDYTFVYQGGAIYRFSENDVSMIAPPPVGHYDLTLSIGLLRVTGDGISSDRTSIAVSAGDQRLPAFPDLDRYYSDGSPLDNPVENGTAEVVVQSPYYEGWAAYFEQRATGAVTTDPGNETVVVELNPPEEVGFTDGFQFVDENGYSSQGGPPGSELDPDSYEEGTYMPSPEGMIQEELDQAAGDNDNGAISQCLSDGTFGDEDAVCTIESGTYYFDGDTDVIGDIEFDTSDGNVTIAVDGDFLLGNNRLEVMDDSDNGVTYYIAGSFDMQGDGYVGTANEATEATRNVFFVGDQVFHQSEGEGTPTFEGILYAPNADIVTKGNPTIRGAVVSNSFHHQGAVNLEFDEDIIGTEFEVSGHRVLVTYLHVSENTAILEVD